uniref:Transcriptional adapter 1 n=1 Tax=Anthurium amnicola TaxID=1678845 RepID=A0A1D1YWT7_9ARAE
MRPPPQHSRINLAELKSLISRKLGPDRAQRYFSYINRLLCQKLSKSEFDKLCLETLGRQNVPLHNQFIRSIFRNASVAKVPPPPIHDKDTLRRCKAIGKESPSTDDVFCPTSTVTPVPPVWSNGPILPPSPRKFRSTNCRIKDRPSPLGPNGKIHAIAHQLQVPADEAIIRENGDVITWDHQRRGLAEPPTKRQRIEKPSPCDQVSVHSKDPHEVLVAEDAQEVEQIEGVHSNRGPLQAPLGIPFCPASVGGARRTAPLPMCSTSGVLASNYYSGELYHTEVLMKRMEQIAVAQGLEGITMDCANLLSDSVDAYLTRLIRSCVEIVGAKSVHESIKHPVFKQQSHGKIVNGIWPGNHMHIQSSVGPLEGTQELKSHRPVSMLDFRVAMELNPWQLGEDWPLLLEKVYFRSFEE